MTSFTTTDDFGDEGDFGLESGYPEFFGLTLTPKVTGISIAVLGLLIAGYLGWTQLLPAINELSTLQTEKAEKENQLDQLSESQFEQRIVVKARELEDARRLKQEVESLFAQDRTLETLLLDANSFANFSNLRITSYTPAGDKQTVGDDSFGPSATNNLQVRTYNLNLEGSFQELQLFIQDLERLQPLLVVQDFNTTVSTPQQYLLENDQVIPVGQPILNSTITVSALFADVQQIAPPQAEGEETTTE